LQGEFGIGLLSFWTVGETLMMTSSGADQRVYQMVMSKGDPRYSVNPRRVLFAETGTEPQDQSLARRHPQLERREDPVLSGLGVARPHPRHPVRVTVVDKLARKQYQVEPRQFEGRLLHPAPDSSLAIRRAMPNCISRNRLRNCRSPYPSGTRVIEDIGTLPGLERTPWSSRYLQGLIDVPY